MLYIILAFLIILADQASKYFVTLFFSQGSGLDIIPNVLRLTYVTNSGGAFSMFSDKTLILTIVSAAVCVLILVLIIVLKKANFIRTSLAFILGGAIGNLIDRIVMGYVVDMFEPLFIDFAVFNIADIFITVGAVLFVIGVIFFWPKADAAEEEEGEEEAVNNDPAPMTYSKPKNAKERRENRKAKKYGPDIDETTIIIPVDEVKAALDTKTAEPVNMEDTMIAAKPAAKAESAEVKEAPVKAEPAPAKTVLEEFDIPDFSVSSSDTQEFTLEDILKEYGHDI